MNDICRVVSALKGVFDELGLGWFVFGAQAVVVRGHPRMTADLDLTIQASDDDLPELVRGLTAAEFDVRVEDVEDFVRKTRVMPVVHRPTTMPVDVVVAGTPLESLFLAGATLEDFGGVDAPVISAEHLVVTKLLAGRPKDLEDVRGVLAASGADFDDAAARDLLEQLDAALDRSDLAPALDAELARRPPSDE